MPFIIVFAIARLCPDALYAGEFINNTREEYENMYWFPSNICPKPTWEDLVEVMKLTKEEVYTAKLKSVSSQFHEFLETLNNQYTDEEQTTWPVQIEEARLYVEQSEMPTPFLDNMVVTRGKGETKAQLVQKIMKNNNRYRAYLGNLAGQEQALRDALYAMLVDAEKTADDMESVKITFSVPWPSCEDIPLR